MKWAQFRANAWLFGILLFVSGIIAMLLGFGEGASSAITGLSMALIKLVDK